MTFFTKPVDRRSRSAMVEFLTKHYRYDTMSSWNRSTSYAQCVKLHRLGLNSQQLDAAYGILDVEEYWREIDSPIHEFTEKMNGAYTIGSNGRSGGYLVLYESQYKSSEYKSVCRSCGQQNYKRAARKLEGAEAVIAGEIVRNQGGWHDNVYLDQSSIRELALTDEEKLAIIRKLKPEFKDCTMGNRCGRCGAEGENGRVNYEQAPRLLSTYPGRAIDQDEDFAEWSMDQLRSRVELVTAFDQACDEIRDAFLSLIGDFAPVSKTIMVPQTVTVLEPRSSL